jgi:hypothetical protein
MKAFFCTCGNRLFFENSKCLQCDAMLGFCPCCDRLVSLISTPDGQLSCANRDCGSTLVKCANYQQYEVCNRCIPAAAPLTEHGLCDYCCFNDVVPDLSIPGNLQKWYRLEVAKRRLLYLLDLLRLPYRDATPRLSFDFRADVMPAESLWRTIGGIERVYTGHADGKITINLREADDAEREKLRVDLNESHRTLIGHFRHEIGHYFWDALIKDQKEAEFTELFGDHQNPGYSDALNAYYQQGPPADWAQRYISAYASAHPWEDFAETFALYLNIVAVLDTANEFGLATDVEGESLDKMVTRYQQIGVMVNELNRNMGLLDLVPHVITPGVMSKCEFVQQLVADAQSVPAA